MESGLNHFWSTPVMYDQVKDLDALAQFTQELFLTIDLDNPPSDSHKHDVLGDGGEAAKHFETTVVLPAFDTYLKKVSGESLDTMDGYELRSWVKPTRSGYQIPLHNHSRAIISGVFYILCEEQGSGGDLHLIDPKVNANRGYHKYMQNLFAPESIAPKTGDFILFPSYLYHYTTIFTGERRIALGVDLHHRNYQRETGLGL